MHRPLGAAATLRGDQPQVVSESLIGRLRRAWGRGAR